ncbi:hypothetical protein D9758_000191 [Tetrapyrgos nigripes]|uniref:Endonuclease/exonuclease/phosphatase domain-containing protein n=1 Tax=Tetrapyrgos nigripes TaxID=182062 RepID=A0A8H5H1L5_9AGAR|nr:hypothetical protein D9758_000191 [Tetrapyrgos nigripes]
MKPSTLVRTLLMASSSSKRSVSLTPEQIALSEARKAKRLKQQQEKASLPQNQEQGNVLSRPWLQLEHTRNVDGANRVRIFTWNLLAQCLVRRELFPTSDCLKAAQREHMLYRELVAQEADILCLQEVDRLEKLLPVLEKAGYSYCYASGPRKKHGCLIAFKKDSYQELDTRLVHYDDEEIRSEGSEIARRGSSFRTKNIGHIVALKNKQSDFGLIVATTHLFWHPRYTYERARQAGILKREVVKFRDTLNRGRWPCIISGGEYATNCQFAFQRTLLSDFNFAPDDAAYSLVTGDPLLPSQIDYLKTSQVVHATIDPSVTPDPAKAITQDENEEEADPDRTITNARPAAASDGLLSPTELHDLFASSGPPLKSAYDIGMRNFTESNNAESVPLFGNRVDLQPDRHGAYEPQWTSYTHYWKTVLDYIFVIDSSSRSSVTGLLVPPKTEDLEPGLPRKGVCGSDHVSLSADLLFST